MLILGGEEPATWFDDNLVAERVKSVRTSKVRSLGNSRNCHRPTAVDAFNPASRTILTHQCYNVMFGGVHEAWRNNAGCMPVRTTA
ncbi:hypothetical protein Poly21_09140 [Allorhodopirellula heiligendammensis]|uniref:Uncharacterized protein n=1 Tax=Allorhodopirellula heiligendammensis TaxID=2714739 RepID=A0A5C6C3L9_9BACT|nr:hypothetical protein Poly21_09140 [Allorhodopirellula heiligendammensis]